MGEGKDGRRERFVEFHPSPSFRLFLPLPLRFPAFHQSDCGGQKGHRSQGGAPSQRLSGGRGRRRREQRAESVEAFVGTAVKGRTAFAQATDQSRPAGQEALDNVTTEKEGRQDRGSLLPPVNAKGKGRKEGRERRGNEEQKKRRKGGANARARGRQS